MAACSGVEDPAIEPIASRCPIAYCGSNSATVDHYGFHELNLDGLTNQEGFRILGMSWGGQLHDLSVTKSRILAHRAHTVVSGRALEGAVIYLEHANQQQYALTIAEVSAVAEVVPPFDEIETYRFQWALITQDHLPRPVNQGDVLPLLPGFEKPQDVCPFVDVDVGGTAEWDEAALMPNVHALVFEGDRINTRWRTVAAQPDPRWFNIGCGPDTLVKLRLTRSTLHTTKGNWRLAQATLKMLSADYCGTGASFTMRGEPLVWSSLSGMQLRSSPTSFEARWNEHGALCLDTPRALDTKLSDLAAAFPDIERAIAAECTRPPPCATTSFTQFQPGEYAISGNRDL